MKLFGKKNKEHVDKNEKLDKKSDKSETQGLLLQDVDFEDFCKKMNNKETFTLK